MHIHVQNRIEEHTIKLEQALPISAAKKRTTAHSLSMENARAEIASLAKFPDENPGAVLRVTSTGEILYSNPASKIILDTWGCKTGENLPEEIFNICLDENSQPQKTVVELDVNTMNYSFLFIPIRGTDYINIYGRDVTAEKEADRIKAEFIAGVSHELRTPLAPILGWSEILLEEEPGSLNVEQREFIQTIYESGKHLHRLVDDLLDITSLEARKFNIHKVKVSIAEPIMKAIELISQNVEKKQIDLSVSIQDNLPDIDIDVNRIQQVFVNLLTNAVKFTPEAGKISLCAVYEPEEDALLVSVQDTGIGIPEKNLSKIFSRFFRSENAVKANIQGTGLGLFIAKGIVEAHNGMINVQSVEEEGSLFEVRLPVKG